MSAENFIFIDFFAVKADGSDVYPGICKEVFIYCTAKKSMKMNFSANKIYSITIFLRLQICKISTDVRDTLKPLLAVKVYGSNCVFCFVHYDHLLVHCAVLPVRSCVVLSWQKQFSKMTTYCTKQHKMHSDKYDKLEDHTKS